MTFLTAGGGGYGDPHERTRADVARDLTAGIVSPQAASNAYGIPGTEPMIQSDRKQRLVEAMAESGIDLLLVYGNAWQSDYLRYTTDYSILEGQGLALVRSDGQVTLYLDSPLEVDRAQIECPASRSCRRPTCIATVDKALERFRNQRIGAAPYRLLPRRLAARAKDLQLNDQTAFLDRLLMQKMESEIAAMRRAAKLADEGYAGVQERCASGPCRLRADRRDRSFLPRQRRRPQFHDHRRRRRGGARHGAAERHASSSAATW